MPSPLDRLYIGPMAPPSTARRHTVGDFLGYGRRHQIDYRFPANDRDDTCDPRSPVAQGRVEELVPAPGTWLTTSDLEILTPYGSRSRGSTALLLVAVLEGRIRLGLADDELRTLSLSLDTEAMTHWCDGNVLPPPARHHTGMTGVVAGRSCQHSAILPHDAKESPTAILGSAAIAPTYEISSSLVSHHPHGMTAISDTPMAPNRLMPGSFVLAEQVWLNSSLDRSPDTGHDSPSLPSLRRRAHPDDVPHGPGTRCLPAVHEALLHGKKSWRDPA